MNFEFGYHNGFTFDFALPVPFNGMMVPIPPNYPFPFAVPAGFTPQPQFLPSSQPLLSPQLGQERLTVVDAINPALLWNVGDRSFSPELASVDGEGGSEDTAGPTPTGSDTATVVAPPSHFSAGGLADSDLKFPPAVSVPQDRLAATASHEMATKRAASKVAATVSQNASGRFVCPVDGCVRDFGARCSLTRHLWSNVVACPQKCDAIVRRGNDNATMGRHIRLYCEKTPRSTRLRNRALEKAKTKAKTKPKTKMNAKKGRGSTRKHAADDDDDDYKSRPAKRARTL